MFITGVTQEANKPSDRRAHKHHHHQARARRLEDDVKCVNLWIDTNILQTSERSSRVRTETDGSFAELKEQEESVGVFIRRLASCGSTERNELYGPGTAEVWSHFTWNGSGNRVSVIAEHHRHDAASENVLAG